MNLLEKKYWDYAYPWGTIISPDTDKEVCMTQNLVTYHPDGSVHFGCAKALFTGWKTAPDGKPVEAKTPWGVGAVIAKEIYRTHFGTYKFIFSLPDFRGSWPAIWLIDLHPEPPKGDGMGLPPEIDIFEQFRKDSFLTRFHITHTFHQGPTYTNNIINQKTYWKLWPLDLNKIEISFTWTNKEMVWVVNGKKIMTVPASTPKYPLKPMNLIINSGIGPDWTPKSGKFEDFILYEASYQP